MSGHTPGPWVVGERNRDILVEISEGAGWHEIALSVDTEANAHLIATAPYLLEAADRLCWSIWALAESGAGFAGENVVDQYGNIVESVASILREMDDAIAKAKGEA